MSSTDELLANNEAYAGSFDKADLPLPPGRKVAVVACMDARLNVYGALGLQEGDAHVIRNAGGVVTDDAIRSLAISQRLLGTEEIVAVHPAQGRDPRVRLRGRDRPAARGELNLGNGELGGKINDCVTHAWPV
ncbi:MAG: carbonic anhydrase [Solirubrobacteraceae bacterium]